MSSDRKEFEREFDKLHKKIEQASKVRKTTQKKADDAYAAYHHTAADDGAKWNRAIALRDKHTAAFYKEEAAFKALQTFLRKRAQPARKGKR